MWKKIGKRKLCVYQEKVQQRKLIQRTSNLLCSARVPFLAIYTPGQTLPTYLVAYIFKRRYVYVVTKICLIVAPANAIVKTDDVTIRYLYAMVESLL